MSYETYALVADFVKARRLSAITMKGISREIVPFAVEAIITGEAGARLIRLRKDARRFR